jgi:hypothetical protein
MIGWFGHLGGQLWWRNRVGENQLGPMSKTYPSHSHCLHRPPTWNPVLASFARKTRQEILQIAFGCPRIPSGHKRGSSPRGEFAPHSTDASRDLVAHRGELKLGLKRNHAHTRLLCSFDLRETVDDSDSEPVLRQVASCRKPRESRANHHDLLPLVTRFPNIDMHFGKRPVTRRSWVRAVPFAPGRRHPSGLDRFLSLAWTRFFVKFGTYFDAHLQPGAGRAIRVSASDRENAGQDPPDTGVSRDHRYFLSTFDHG